MVSIVNKFEELYKNMYSYFWSCCSKLGSAFHIYTKADCMV